MPPAARLLAYLDPAGHLARVAALNASTGALEDLDVAGLTITVSAVDAAALDSVTIVTRLADDDLAVIVDVATPADVDPATTITVAVDLATAAWSTAGQARTFLATDPGIAYGATVADVEALVPNITLAATPSRADVVTFLRDVAARVTARLGPFDDLPAPWLASMTAAARALVALGAAAYTEDAAHPERSGSQGDNAYGPLLWSRFTTGLDDLEHQLDQARNEATGGGHAGAPAAAFPPPILARDHGY